MVAGTGEHTWSRKTPGSHVCLGSDSALCTGARLLPRGISASEAGYGVHGGAQGEPAHEAGTIPKAGTILEAGTGFVHASPMPWAKA